MTRHCHAPLLLFTTLGLITLLGCDKKHDAAHDEPPAQPVSKARKLPVPYPHDSESCDDAHIAALQTWIEHTPKSPYFVQESQPLQLHATHYMTHDTHVSLYASKEQIILNDRVITYDELHEASIMVITHETRQRKVLGESMDKPIQYELGFHPDLPMTQVLDILSAIPFKARDELFFTFSDPTHLNTIKPIPKEDDRYFTTEQGIRSISESARRAYKDSVYTCEAMTKLVNTLEFLSPEERRNKLHTEFASTWKTCSCPGSLELMLLILVGDYTNTAQLFFVTTQERVASSKALPMTLPTQGSWSEHYTSLIASQSQPLCLTNLTQQGPTHALACTGKTTH